MNQIILVGRLTNNPILEETENGKKTATLELAIPRMFKNDNGEYDVDYISVSLTEKNVLSNVDAVIEYCRKGDTIGVRGRIAKLPNNDMQVIAEKVSFLSSNSKYNK